MMLNENNIIIIVGDIGSGVNLVKNLLLVPENTFWLGTPTTNRVESIINNIYPAILKNNLTNWMTYEYILRSWQDLLGVDIADTYADIGTQAVKQHSQSKKIVFLTHWPEIAVKLKTRYPGITLVSLYPKNIKDLAWQIKTYILKKSIETLQEFSFSTDIEKTNFINEFGLESYYQTNVLNMFEIMWNRHKDYKSIPGYTIEIGNLYGADKSWIKNLKLINPDLNIDDSEKIIEAWKALHNFDQEIWDFKYFDLVKKSPLFQLVDQK